MAFAENAGHTLKKKQKLAQYAVIYKDGKPQPLVTALPKPAT